MDYDVLIERANGKETELYSGIGYVCNKNSISDPKDLNCRIIVTDKFKEDYKKFHYKPSDGINPNGTMIPPVFQSEQYKNSLNNTHIDIKTIVLINNEKLKNVNSEFYISVIVHELGHCADYVYRLPGFQTRYGIKMNEVIENTVGDAIGGYFSSYTEVRAKYLQELFLLEHHEPYDYQDVFYKKLKKQGGGEIYNFDFIEGDNVYYYAQHIAGKIRCWEDFFINELKEGYYTEEKKTVTKIKKLFLEKCEYHTIIRDMYEVWDWNLLINKCDQIYKKYNGDINVAFVG